MVEDHPETRGRTEASVTVPSRPMYTKRHSGVHINRLERIVSLPIAAYLKDWDGDISRLSLQKPAGRAHFSAIALSQAMRLSSGNRDHDH
jgi:hypothetical protein